MWPFTTDTTPAFILAQFFGGSILGNFGKQWTNYLEQSKVTVVHRNLKNHYCVHSLILILILLLLIILLFYLLLLLLLLLFFFLFSFFLSSSSSPSSPPPLFLLILLLFIFSSSFSSYSPSFYLLLLLLFLLILLLSSSFSSPPLHPPSSPPLHPPSPLSSPSSSLAPQPLKFRLGFPHDRCPFSFVLSSFSPSIHTHIPQDQFSIFHPLYCMHPLF